MSSVSTFSIVCHKCGRTAAEFSLTKHSGRSEIIVTGFLGTVTTRGIGNDPVDEKLFGTLRILAETDVPALHALDPDIFGFICQRCGYAYCVNCWKYIHATSDEGFYDATRGVCPQGHEQMLQD
jgi:hypothetical protein